MSPGVIGTVFALAFGFGVAGLLSSAYQLATARPLSFRLLKQEPRVDAVAALACLVFAAPLLIVRNVVRQRRALRARADLIFTALAVAVFWSLMSGTVVVMGLHRLAVIAA